ncbi:hypothetical protein B0H14DRAFT_2810333 [Mycena olivaceomarginata]|nr:hypothetical protein B0H14DRAFT_2810332 [Mycena olivaceomarginata]KAJ7829284.1 hypothetical protein B0H14DRAFT_2810333 [Mycena olivaceomarginata]
MQPISRCRLAAILVGCIGAGAVALPARSPSFNAPGVSLGGNPLDGTIVSPTATLPLVESPTRTIAGLILHPETGCPCCESASCPMQSD